MKMNYLPSLLLTLLFLCGSLQAAEPTKAELQVRFKTRYLKLLSLKAEGKIGETQAGVLETVTAAAAAEKAVSRIVAEENADRLALYRILSLETKVGEAEVAKRNAIRLYKKARAGDYLKGKDGKWHKKRG
ncbi:MAG: DUF1318 domain-containing protein [Planctomycetota bacterium]|jgi:uncharacterized protein YdbL (DUF1318 family)